MMKKYALMATMKGMLGTAFVLLLCGSGVIAQILPVDTLTKKFDRYRKEQLQEKIYVHTDRTYYLTGEVLWLRVYCTDGSYHRPLDVSKVVYVEVVDKVNEAVLQGKIPMVNGAGSGSFFLPTSLTSGNYTLRAYTNWMKNFDPRFYFHEDITIVNPFVKLDGETVANTGKVSYDVQFFPEGGNLVNKVKSRVAFKVADKTGKGIAFTGAIVNEHSDTVAYFKPTRFGMGSFEFIPDGVQKYRAVIRDGKKMAGTYVFPEVRERGVVLSVKDSTAQLLRVTVTGTLNEIPVAYLFVHARQIIAKAEMKFVKNGKVTFVVDKGVLPEGISHLTIFNEEQQPVAERLYFKKPQKNLELAVKSDLLQYDTRHKGTLAVTASAAADLSVAIYKADSLPAFRAQTISEYLWLTSDLPGVVESPEYYFSDAPDVAEVTDNLMLTHGWRRFVWSDVLGKRTGMKYVPEYRAHTMRAHVTDASGNPMKDVLTYVSYPGRITKIYGSRSNALGEVQFEMQDFWGTQKIIAQLNPKKDSLLKIKMENPFSGSFASRVMPSFALTSAWEKQLLDRSVSMQVQDIFNRPYTERFIKPVVDSTAFYGKADETYFLDDYTRFPVMEEVMREYVPGVFVRKHRDGFHFIVLDNVNKSVFRDDPMILLDGLPIFDVDQIMEFDPLKVKKLEVVTRKYYNGPLVFPGIVSYSTYKGDLSGFQIDPRAVSLNYEGLQLQREFYAPAYDTPAMRGDRNPDSRSLLYWNASFPVTAGTNKLEFTTSDVTGTFQVVIQGLSRDGKSGVVSHTFFVQKEVN